MTILITGSRDWSDSDLIRSVLQRHVGNVTLIHGACRGADLLCESVARELGFKIISMPVQWGKHGRAAGPIRNRAMVDLALAKEGDLIMYAFHDNIASSAGTKDCVNYARSKGITPTVVSHPA